MPSVRLIGQPGVDLKEVLAEALARPKALASPVVAAPGLVGEQTVGGAEVLVAAAKLVAGTLGGTVALEEEVTLA